MGCWNEAISEGQMALNAAEEFSDNSAISFAAWILSFAYMRKLDLSRAIKYATYAVDRASTPADKAWAQTGLAVAWLKTGEVKKGIQILASTAKTYQAVNWIFGVVWTKAYLGEGYWLNGTYDEAKRVLEESLELAGRYGFRFYIAFSHRILGEISRITTPDQSSAHFEKSISILKEIKAENELALAYGGYGRLYKQQRRIEKAREFFKKALKILESLGTMNEPEKIRKELAELPEI
jgi:tetratricopeptide (TPR) repeat protein